MGPTTVTPVTSYFQLWLLPEDENRPCTHSIKREPPATEVGFGWSKVVISDRRVGALICQETVIIVVSGGLYVFDPTQGRSLREGRGKLPPLRFPIVKLVYLRNLLKC